MCEDTCGHFDEEKCVRIPLGTLKKNCVRVHLSILKTEMCEDTHVILKIEVCEDTLENFENKNA